MARLSKVAIAMSLFAGALANKKAAHADHVRTTNYIVEKIPIAGSRIPDKLIRTCIEGFSLGEDGVCTQNVDIPAVPGCLPSNILGNKCQIKVPHIMTCPEPFILDGDQCTLTHPVDHQYYCPKGFFDNGAVCERHEYNDDVIQCDTGVLVGENCVSTKQVDHLIRKQCPPDTDTDKNGACWRASEPFDCTDAVQQERIIMSARGQLTGSTPIGQEVLVKRAKLRLLNSREKQGHEGGNHDKQGHEGGHHEKQGHEGGHHEKQGHEGGHHEKQGHEGGHHEKQGHEGGHHEKQGHQGGHNGHDKQKHGHNNAGAEMTNVARHVVVDPAVTEVVTVKIPMPRPPQEVACEGEEMVVVAPPRPSKVDVVSKMCTRKTEVDPMTIISCPEGFFDIGDKCQQDLVTAPSKICSTGLRVNGMCPPLVTRMAKHIGCPEGAFKANGQCFAVDAIEPTMVCGKGYQDSAEGCLGLFPFEEYHCPQGLELDGDRCIGRIVKEALLVPLEAGEEEVSGCQDSF